MKVLFLHGIEARGWPLKAELIASLHGVAVHCPDLGSADWMQRVWITAGFLIVVFLAVAVLIAYAMFHRLFHVLLGVVCALSTPFILWAIGLCIVRRCLRRAYDDATERARRVIEVLDPDVIVGQSFGAVVALRLAEWRPLLLLSCARRYFCEWAGVPMPICSTGMPVCVVHGTEDHLCPIADAADLVRTAKGDAWLVAREGEGHMLPGLGASGLAEVLHQLGVQRFLPAPTFEEDPLAAKKPKKSSAGTAVPPPAVPMAPAATPASSPLQVQDFDSDALSDSDEEKALLQPRAAG